MLMKILTHPATRFAMRCYDTVMLATVVYILFLVLPHLVFPII